jgi:glycerol-3-phosphate cytidylyltransferase
MKIYRSTRNLRVTAQFSSSTREYVLYYEKEGKQTPLGQVTLESIENSKHWELQPEVHEYGFVAGAFDVIHPGYIKLFRDAKEHCKRLIVLIHADPSIERPHKLKPILSIEERADILLELQSIDQVSVYHTEEGFLNWMHLHPEYVRFLGDDYIDQPFTGKELSNPVIYLDRSHQWSTTKYKKSIHHQVEVQHIHEMLNRNAATKSS